MEYNIIIVNKNRKREEKAWGTEGYFLNNKYRNNETISNRKVYSIGFILLVMVIGFAFYNTKDLITEGAIKKEELMNEYNLLQPLPGAIRTTLSSHNKSNSAIVSASYRSSKSYEEIKSFLYG